MPNYCVAVGCKNTAKKGSEYSFHRFPHQNPNLLKKWVHAIRRKQWKPTKHSFICSDHFHESCFVIRARSRGSNTARCKAVQAIFKTFPSYHQKDIKLRTSPRKRQYVAHEVVAPSEVEPSTSGPSPSELQVEHSYFALEASNWLLPSEQDVCLCTSTVVSRIVWAFSVLKTWMLWALVFDGSFTNQSTAVKLGWKMSVSDLETWFLHPETDKTIHVIFDVCQMVVLLINLLGDKKVICHERNGKLEQIRWWCIESLNRLQEDYVGSQLQTSW